MLQKFPYQLKLYLSFALIVSVILCICGGFFFQYNSRMIRTSLENNSMDSLNLITSRFDTTLNDMDKVLKNLHASKSFTDLVFPIPPLENNYFIRYPSVNSSLKSMLTSVLAVENDNSSLYYTSQYYDSLGVQVRQNPYLTLQLSKKPLQKLTYLADALSTKQYRLFLPPHQNPRINSPELVFTAVRPIRDTYHTYGVLEYSRDVSELDKIFNLPNNPDIHEMILLNENHEFLYSNITDAAEDEISNLYQQQTFTEPAGHFYANTNTLMCYSQSEVTGWTLLIRKDISNEISQIHTLANMILFSYLLGFLVLLLCLFLLTKSLTRPLRQLKNSLSVLEMNQDIHLTLHQSNNEITILANAIEDILNRLRLQNERLIEARKRTLQAHYDAMEAQLNPHFLYNTLSVIGLCGMEPGSHAVPKMCAELAKLLRYSISYSHKTVSLTDEIDNITSYLYIMKMRHEHMLQYEWDLSPSIPAVNVPKLILQPIIENCFQHGFQEAPPPWHIFIRTYAKDNYWFVSIQNSGQLFETERQQKLYEHFEQLKHKYLEGIMTAEDTDRQGFGLENTIMRLAIFYHGREHFEIRTDSSYTTVIIGGPIYEDEN